ncbi:hypothetical protein LWI28_022388 [Acer negundo]|uniref:Reverse transcriptase domain-containing protein n=1 Tax=Acer negundo TaxID=4023 RepID=A0AAD5J7T4_ACENE|nr:hypothetical protein LWI28_022388 [Acer negundo]
MEKIVVGYFDRLFNSLQPSTEDFDRVTSMVRRLVYERNCLVLDMPFIAEEIRKAVFDMHPTKAPGPDGMPALFYQKFWSIVGKGVMEACLRCLNEGDSVEVINSSLIALIPKCHQTEEMTDYRPISLCNVAYKIVAKTLANRFKLVLGKVILETQIAFIPGRLISDNAIIGFECLHALKRHKRKEGSIAIKLDISRLMTKWSGSF